MTELANSVADFLAAISRSISFIGRDARRRSEIREDLRLLEELDASPHLDDDNKRVTRFWLNNHVVLRVAEYSRVDLRTVRRKVPWSSVILCSCIWIPLGWLTFHLVERGYGWRAAFPAVPAAFFAVATLGMLFNAEEIVAPGTELDGAEHREDE